jgi:outer membrane phospholipase A
MNSAIRSGADRDVAGVQIGARGCPDAERPLMRWNRRTMHVDRVAELQRWQDSGAVWQVISVDRFTSDDPQLLSFIGDRMTSEE